MLTMPDLLIQPLPLTDDLAKLPATELRKLRDLLENEIITHKHRCVEFGLRLQSIRREFNVPTPTQTPSAGPSTQDLEREVMALALVRLNRAIGLQEEARKAAKSGKRGQ